MQTPFEAAINQICEEKHLDKTTVIQAIESAIAAAYRKEYGTDFQKLTAVFDLKLGTAKIFNNLEVVETIEYVDSQITLKDAKKHKKDAKLEDTIQIDVTPTGVDKEKYGRIATQTAKQVIIQRLQEAERESTYQRYKDRLGEVISAQVQRIEANGYVFITLEGATVVLFPKEQIPRERYYIGQRLKVYIAKVEKTSKGPSIIVSRSHAKLIEKLMEIEIPEVKEKTVLIKSISREPGVRTKIAVQSKEHGIDPVGSCVGQKGVRIQAITNEVGDEKIDIIEYSDNIVQMILNSLSPAKIMSIETLEDQKRARVFVMEDQRSLAIGKNGQNVRLASKLLHWEIDILDFIEGEKQGQAVTDALKKGENEEASSEEKILEDIEGITRKILRSLKEAGIEKTADLEGQTTEYLSTLPGIGKKTAEKILEAL